MDPFASDVIFGGRLGDSGRPGNVKPARKSVGGSREPKLSASSGVYGYQPQPRLPRRTAQDSGAGQRILCGTAVPPPAGPSAHLLRLGLLAAGGGGSGAADV